MLFLELCGTHKQIYSLTKFQLYWPVRKSTGNPLKVLEPCLKLPAEVLLKFLLLSTVVFSLFWRFPFREKKKKINEPRPEKENTGRTQLHGEAHAACSEEEPQGRSCSVP